MNRDEARMGDGGCGGNAAPYVLGALTDAEHDAFLAHLGSCAVCREEVAALQAVTAALPGAAPQVPAPRQLKRRVMTQVRAEARGEKPATRTSRSPRRPPRRRAGALALAAAAAAVALVLVLVPGGGGSATRYVRASVTAPGARGEVRLSAGQGQLVLNGMPLLAPGRVYELWLKRGGGPVPTDALFTVTRAGGDATVAIPGGVAGVRTVMVTSEPLGGSRAPTSTPTVVAQL